MTEAALDSSAFAAEAPVAHIAVVVPARNEAPRIASVIRSVPSRVARIVLVDDASSDATRAHAEAVGDPRLVVLTHAQHRGVGAAIDHGYRDAFAHGADVVVVMAGDAQMDPLDLDALLEPVVRRHVGYAKGNRLDHPSARAVTPRMRQLGGEALSLLTSLAVRRRVRDSQCGYTAIDRTAWSVLSKAPLWPSYGYPNDVLVRLARAGVATCDVPVRPRYVEKHGGMGIHHAVALVPFVLARALMRRS